MERALRSGMSKVRNRPRLGPDGRWFAWCVTSGLSIGLALFFIPVPFSLPLLGLGVYAGYRAGKEPV